MTEIGLQLCMVTEEDEMRSPKQPIYYGAEAPVSGQESVANNR